MVFLSKLIPLFLYPLGLAVALMLLSLLLSARRLRAWLLVTSLLVLLVFSNRWVAHSLARSLEWRYLPPDPLPAAEAIVLLGGGTEAPSWPRMRPEVNSAADRLFYAAELYRAGKAPLVILSGGNIDWLEERSTTPAQDMRAILVLLGVPESAMILEDQSRNTEENARYTAGILKDKGINSFLLVTSAMHMPRSMRLFESQGFQPTPAPCDFGITQAGWDELGATPQAFAVNLLPNVGSLSLSTLALKEYFGLAYSDIKLTFMPE